MCDVTNVKPVNGPNFAKYVYGIPFFGIIKQL